MKFRRAITIVMSIVLMICATACTKSKKTSKPVNQKVELTTCDSADFLSFSSCGHSGGFQNYSANVYETLIQYEDNKLKPCLATSWEVKDNEITLELRKGVKFTDGRDFNAKVVKLNLDSLHKYKLNSVSWFQVVGLLDHVEVLEEYKVKIVLKQPYYAALYDLASNFALGMMSPAVFEVDGDPYEKVEKTAGTGPYMITDKKQNAYYVFERNKKYWGEAPKVEKLTVKIIPDLDSRTLSLRNGDIDFILGVNQLSSNTFKEMQTAEGIKCKLSENHSKSHFTMYNSKSSMMKNLEMRKAVTQAVDKKTLIKGILMNQQDNADYMFDPKLEHCGIDMTPYKFDTKSANKILDNAGWKLNDDTHIREKNGKKLTLKLIYPAHFGSNDELAQAIKSQLAKVGVEIKVESYEVQIWSSKIRKGEYDLTLSFTYGVPYDPHIQVSGIVGGGLDGVAMAGLENKKEIDASVIKLMKTSKSEEVDKYLGEVIKAIHESYANMPLTYEKEMAIWNTKSINNIKFFGQPGLPMIKNITPAK